MIQSTRHFLQNACDIILSRHSKSLLGKLDSPKTPDEIRTGSFNVFSGWLFDKRNNRITDIEVFQGRDKLGSCNYGLQREDVSSAYPQYPQARESGFFGWVPVQHKTGASVFIYALDEHGGRHMIARQRASWRARAALLFKRKIGAKHSETRQPQKKAGGPVDIPPKILIAGLAKSGTTGLFSKIGNSLVSCGGEALKTKLLFEPRAYSGPGKERILAKIIISPENKLSLWGEKREAFQVRYDDFANFNKKILLHRDPRDRLISTLLYSAQGTAFKSDTKNLPAFLDLLHKKEQNPLSVSVLELIAIRLRLKKPDLNTWKAALEEYLARFLDFRRRDADWFYYRYEDFVQDKTEKLERFLGFPLAGDAIVEKGLSRVVRTKKSGGLAKLVFRR